ncbi:MAG TPA: tetratricopeptide repeat protein [Rhodocyclaceae bacterium]|jgi:tetratricopeptide (TPR) repeat protein|nr:tetratricopeptide repeat protein [Rhodocyclaceae bacterium]
MNLLALAEMAFQSGDLQSAHRLLLQLVSVEPRNARAHELLGYVYGRSGDNTTALRHLATAVELDPSPEALYYQGMYLTRMDRYEEAAIALRHALTLTGGFFEGYHDLGMALSRLGRYLEALPAYEQAGKVNPDSAPLHYNWGKTLEGCKRFEEARLHYQKATELNPEFVQAWVNLGAVLTEMHQNPESLACYDKALVLDPQHARALADKSIALFRLGRFDEACACNEKALRICSDDAAIHLRYGQLLVELKQHDKALEQFAFARGLAPGFADIDLEEALARLVLGQFEEGWAKYESRWTYSKARPLRHVGIPAWQGQYPLVGKRLLIWAEQGLGDSIQFSRYLPALRQFGCDVVFEVQADLALLLRDAFPECQVVAQDDPLPACDYQCPLLSLPLVFKTTLASIPSRPAYLTPPALALQLWQTKLKSRLSSNALNIGIAFSGNRAHVNDHERSMTLQDVLPLTEHVHLFIIQKHLSDADSEIVNGNDRLTFVGDDLHDFTDTAAMVEQMDLIVTVDTSLAHLAGAIGKPVWILLPWAPEWRWLLERTDSPWYPSARLFRQPRYRDWASVIEDVLNAVRRFPASNLSRPTAAEVT